MIWISNIYNTYPSNILLDTSHSSLDDTYPQSLPSTSKYRFKKIASKVFARDPWKSKPHSEVMVTESETLPDLTCSSDDPTALVCDTASINLPLNVHQPSSHPTPINIEPESDINIHEEEICATATDFKNEVLTGVNSHNQKVYDYKVKLKHLISKMDKLSLTNYTVLEDSKTSDENLIFSNELKDTGDYLIWIGKQFVDRATAIQIVASSCPQSEPDNPVSEEDDVIYVSTEQHISDTKIEDDKGKIKSKFIPFKKEKPTGPSSSSSDNEGEAQDTKANAYDIPEFKHKCLQRKGGKYVCSNCNMDFQTKAELRNHFASHTDITFKCNVCSDIYRSDTVI